MPHRTSHAGSLDTCLARCESTSWFAATYASSACSSIFSTICPCPLSPTTSVPASPGAHLVQREHPALPARTPDLAAPQPRRDRAEVIERRPARRRVRARVARVVERADARLAHDAEERRGRGPLGPEQDGRAVRDERVEHRAVFGLVRALARLRLARARAEEEHDRARDLRRRVEAAAGRAELLQTPSAGVHLTRTRRTSQSSSLRNCSGPASAPPTDRVLSPRRIASCCCWRARRRRSASTRASCAAVWMSCRSSAEMVRIVRPSRSRNVPAFCLWSASLTSDARISSTIHARCAR
jgi:hypothetical protein